jgi:hypothetical protein
MQVFVSGLDPLIEVRLVRVVEREFGTVELLGGIADLQRLLVGGHHGDHPRSVTH